MAEFIPGLKLCERFFADAVLPILARRFPSLRYSAARIDTGSDVLGFDTPMSRDHGWGPRCVIYVDEADHAAVAEPIVRAMADELPFDFLGYPTNFVMTDSPVMSPTTRRPINHLVEVVTVRSFFASYLGIDPRQPLSEIDWLTLPSQKLRTIRSGLVFHDVLDELDHCRRSLHWYPHDLWLYLMACQWQRISQEEAFVARAGDSGDELGSRVIAARLVEDLMKLCFLMEQEYPPYAKWFGTAFKRLKCAPEVSPVLNRVVDSPAWQERESELADVYLTVQRLHNALGLTDPLPEAIGPFHNRPYRVPHAGRFAEALNRVIQRDSVNRLPKHVGAVWQFANSTDVLEDVRHCRELAALYLTTTM